MTKVPSDSLEVLLDQWRPQDAVFDRRDALLGHLIMVCVFAVAFLLGLGFGASL